MKNNDEQYVSGRRVGNTTRIVNALVQEFFTIGECHVWDHYPTRKSCERVADLVLRRLVSEHGLTEKDIIFDKLNLIIYEKRSRINNRERE